MSVPTAPFGRTGHTSSRVIFGAAALGGMRQERADQLLDTLLPAGVNHIDTAAIYGESELRLAPWLATHRHEVFVATKTGDRRGPDARASLERSLDRMGVDHVDLVQLHNLVEPDEWDTAFGRDGAVEALAAARDEGLTRFIGVTGHGLRIAAAHARSLDAFPFDSVLLPYNPSLLAIETYRTDVEALLATCSERQVAVQTIKAVARRRWTGDDEPHFSWYEPLRDEGAIGRAVRSVLCHPQLFLNTTSDARVVPAVLRAAEGDLGPPDPVELAADAEAFGISPLFDGAALDRI